MNLTDSELATVLAALRNLEITLRNVDGNDRYLREEWGEHFLFIKDEDLPGPDEIDDLCERLNTVESEVK